MRLTCHRGVHTCRVDPLSRNLTRAAVLLAILGTDACQSHDGNAGARKEANSWQIQAEAQTSTAGVREAALQAARDLNAHLRLLRPMSRTITVRLQDCGTDSEAVWLEEATEILLCDEVLEFMSRFGEPTVAVARFILAHELGHAVADLFDEPAEGSGELEADEFAAVFLIATGMYGQDIATAARLMQSMAEIPDLVPATAAERQTRSEALRCLLDGATTAQNTECGAAFVSARSRWEQRVLIGSPALQ